MRGALSIVLLAGAVSVPAAAAAAAAAAHTAATGCRTAEIRQHDEIVFGHFATRAAALAYARGPKSVGFKGLKVEADGCGDYELEADGADTEQQRTSFAAEGKTAGYLLTFEQTGEPLKPPANQVVGVLARVTSLNAVNTLMWKLARAGFGYIDVAPSGRSWLVLMPQVPLKNALSIAKEVAKAGFQIQFRNG